ncbi:hypothetical protein, partial [Roseiconus lacunae]
LSQLIALNCTLDCDRQTQELQHPAELSPGNAQDPSNLFALFTYAAFPPALGRLLTIDHLLDCMGLLNWAKLAPSE